MIGERLKEERERLDLTQPVFSEVAGAKKRTLIDWEKNISSPTAVQLSALCSIGVDVLYVLTGQRGATVQASSQFSSTAEMPIDEQLLLETYRALPTAKQKKLLADLLTGNTGKKTARKTNAGAGIVIATGKRSQAAGRDVVNPQREE